MRVILLKRMVTATVTLGAIGYEKHYLIDSRKRYFGCVTQFYFPQSFSFVHKNTCYYLK